MPQPHAAPFCAWMLEHAPEQARTLALVDVGCRGGPPEWLRRWPGRLVGVGVDPDTVEVARLTTEGAWPDVAFSAAWVGHPYAEDGLPPGMNRARWRSYNNRTWRRTSSERAQRVLAVEVPPGDPGQQSAPPPMITLDELAAPLPRVDVLKVDTDGHELEVLESGAATLARALVVDIEVQLQGPAHPRANTFSNLDRLLRGAGFELFDLRPHRHSRAGLPAPFWGSGGSPTHAGQTVWADAVYARDVAADPWPDLGDRGWTLAALFELAALPDCAVELVENGLVAGASADAITMLSRGWWGDGGVWASRALAEAPARLHLPELPRLRDRIRAKVAREWVPWRR